MCSRVVKRARFPTQLRSCREACLEEQRNELYSEPARDESLTRVVGQLRDPVERSQVDNLLELT